MANANHVKYFNGVSSVTIALGSTWISPAGHPATLLAQHGWGLAATQGHESASENKGIITKRMTRQQIAEAQAYATRCFENDYKGCD